MPRFAVALGSAALVVLATIGTAAADVTVSNAWVRGTIAPGQASAAYMTLRASTSTSLVAVASPAAKVVELHEMSMQNGVMKMRPVARLELPAGKPVELKPGGYHVMLTDPVHPLKEGESVAITLTMRDANGQESKVTVNAPVRPMTAAPAMGGAHGH